MRLYEMFIGDFEKAAPWSSASIKGCKRFLERVFGLYDIRVKGEAYSKTLEGPFHKTIKKVSSDIENLKFNTAIAALMSLINDIAGVKSINDAEMRTFLILLNPFAPHITEELWEMCGYKGQVAQQKWPVFDESKCQDDVVEIAVSIGGKVKSRISIPADCDQASAIAAAKEDSRVAELIAGKQIIKEIYAPGKLVNIVVK